MPSPFAVNPNCQCCGAAAPTMFVTLHRHIGALVLRFHKTIKGFLCKRCISKFFWEYSAIILFLGWWGLISLFMTPYCLISNIVMYIKSFSLTERA